MCPFCIANMALIAVGATSTGGLTALIANKLRKKAKPEKSPAISSAE